MKKICQTCSNEFTRPGKRIKYCSRECYYKAPKDHFQKESYKKTLSERVLKYYEETPKEIKQKRWDKIGRAKAKFLTSEDVEKIEEVLSLGYISDKRLIMKLANCQKSYKILDKYIADNPEWIKKFRIPKFIPLNVQKWPKEKFIQFTKDVMKYDHLSMEMKYEIKPKSFANICKLLSLPWNKIDTTHRKRVTAPEKFVREYLIELGVDFEREKFINNQKWKIDFKIGDKLIEVQGDFWHANPRIYSYDKLHAIQKSNVLRDVEKHDWIAKNNFELLQIWEYDIKMTPDEVKQTIKKYLYD
jgi:G:T-mismatch repair DNA endonuclease (very short patch repair protein)